MKISLFTTISFLFIFQSINLNAQIPTNGLVAFFPFNGNARDSSSSKTHGTVYNASLTTDRYGQPNSAYQFSGNSSSYIQFPSTNLLNNKYTYSIWAKVNSIPVNGEYTFALNIGSTGGDQSLNISNFSYTIMNGWVSGGYNTVAPNFATNEKKNLSTTVWSHVVCVRDSNFVLSYINGVLVDSVGSNTNKYPYYGSGSVKAMIGKRNDGSRPFNGKIDDVCIYNRPLSKSEVMQLYNDQSTSIQNYTVNKLNVDLYPNPNSSNFLIQINNKVISTHNLNVKIYNSIGQEITDYNCIYHENSILVEHTLSSDLYNIYIYASNGQLLSIEKFIVL